MVTSRHRRAYHRLMSGIKFAQYHNQKLTHMILTCNHDDIRKLTNDVTNLTKRIRREYSLFEYFRVNEFKNDIYHSHLACRTQYIPQDELSISWEAVSGNPVTYIKSIHNKRQASYFLKYLSYQGVTWGYSDNWVFKHFLDTWQYVKADASNLNHALNIWDFILSRYDKAPSAYEVHKLIIEDELRPLSSNHNGRLTDYVGVHVF